MTFLEWAKNPPKDKAIVLDIDGTLVSAGESEVSETLRAAVARLAGQNDVFLFSNKRMPGRNAALAEAFGVPLIDSASKKPFPGVLQNLPSDKPVVVVGDKVLTDGLLAYCTGAEFVHVSRVGGTGEPLPDKVVNAIDDVLWHAWNLCRLLRAGQWIKNLLVFAPLFFARRFLQDGLLAHATAAFVVFCFLASAGYCINDWRDGAADRTHPKKRTRPIASGATSPATALMFAILLVLLAVLLITTYIPQVALIAALYFLSSILYSAYLKRVPIFEMLFFVWFYLARTLAGGAAVGVLLSAWLTLSIVFLALFLVSAKRYAEYRSDRTRAALAHYSPNFLEGMLVMSAGLVVAFYALYTVLGVSSPFAVYSTLPVLGGVMRYLQLSFQNVDAEYPEKLLLKDPGLLFAGLCWLAMMIVVFY